MARSFLASVISNSPAWRFDLNIFQLFVVRPSFYEEVYASGLCLLSP